MIPHSSTLDNPATRLSKAVARLGFTLIEMLVVVAVIALVVSAIAPMIFGTLTSTRITSAGETLNAQISLARQYAVSGNQEVEVRFYQYSDDSSGSPDMGYRAVALLRAGGNDGAAGALGQQLTDTFFLPSGLVISNTAALSPPLTRLSSEQDREGIIKRARSSSYRAFHFFPDGTTDFPLHNVALNQCYFTIGEEAAMKGAAVPKNFFAVQIDPATGRTVTYRP